MRLAVDTSVVLATLEGTTDALLEYAKRGWRLYITEYNLTEVMYVLCRRLGAEAARRAVERLLNSRTLRPYPAADLHGEAAMCKCRHAISLPDCYTIALARRLNTRALFMREKELEKALKRGELADIVQFV
ncbi:hypothetical protein TUZN_0507 [Thermoproteus uzoniensis 768-20]|uniref:Ribonuclease VapC n=1 Tax=Thermoproteus uzoniensis (strain 768-20) TaxID=999630 RepID=F2L3L8_THEU7|nr:PIN domain-containing protein [Thermoproteus uzoniensis]AEA12002.1 hypothetical protein TUZN_0507 [Thermoproteus uzoniensis 768-20]